MNRDQADQGERTHVVEYGGWLDDSVNSHRRVGGRDLQG
ncbi:hypothetical protein PA08_2404 [Cutibacterium modestum P08]|nr:hypothetical protein PA08_2404 [Cutibacterium modestum P08]